MKIRERMVQNKEACDDILHRKSFDVNIRLYNLGGNYEAIIHDIIEYMKICLKTSYEDYTTIRGISGANIGVPFNIIVIRNGDEITPMINPKLLRCSKKMVDMTSNCGSLNLTTGVEVERPEWITFAYYNIRSEKIVVKKFEISEGASTVLHEIEHNLGILIIDKQKKKKKGKRL